jgi:hypothetical protein
VSAAELQSRRAKLLNLIDLAERQTDLVTQARLTEFVCIRVAGFVEQAVRIIYHDHAATRGQAHLAAFVGATLERPGNLNAERLLATVGRFGRPWRDPFQQWLSDEKRSALNSVMGNRNRIAHGDDVSLGIVQMREWTLEVIAIIDWLAEQAT